MDTITPAAAGTFHLVSDPFWIGLYRDHFGSVPKTLAELHARDEELRYSRRMAELKAIAPKLALLDPLLPALAQHGVDFARRDVHLRKQDGIGVVLRFMPTVFNRRDDKLHAALLAVGFREIERKRILSEDQLLLKHGRALYLMIDVSPVEVAA